MGGVLLSGIKEGYRLKNRIAATDREIDQLVYALYEGSEEEMEVVEG